MSKYILFYDKGDIGKEYFYAYCEGTLLHGSGWVNSLTKAIDGITGLLCGTTAVLDMTKFEVLYESSEPLTRENSPELFI